VFEHGCGPCSVAHHSMGQPRCGCVDAKGVRLRYKSGSKKWGKEGVRRNEVGVESARECG